MTLGFSGDPDIYIMYYGDLCCLGLCMVGAAARSTPTGGGLVLTIGRTYSGLNLVDVLPLGPPQSCLPMTHTVLVTGTQNV